MKKVIIYGAGSYGKYLYHAFNDRDGYKVLYFIDQYSSDKAYENALIKKLNKIKSKDLDYEVFITATMKPKKIEERLREIGFKNIKSLKVSKNFLKYNYSDNFFKCMSNVAIENSRKSGYDIDKHLKWEGFAQLADKNTAKTKQVLQMLTDQKSKKIFKDIIKYKLSKSTTKLYPDLTQVQYFPDDIRLFEKFSEIRFVDCGGFDGDTVELLLKKVKNVRNVSTFEPDPDNLNKLQKRVNKLQKKYKNTDISVYPTGVWDKNTILEFNACGNILSSVLEPRGKLANMKNENMLIPVVSLDKSVFGMRPNFIKMDIEGSEKEALIGAERIIKTFKPTLAISVYHKIEDIWDLPLLIHKFNPNYKMYIRLHACLADEMILYCVDDS